MPQVNADSLIPIDTKGASGELLPQLADTLRLAQPLLGLGECILHNIKRDKKHTVLVVNPTGKLLFCKIYHERGIMAGLRRSMFGHRARMAHRRSELFQALGGDTVTSYGYLRVRQRGLAVDSYHFSEYLDGAQTLDDFLAGSSDLAEQQSYMDGAVRALAGLHRQGYVHGDTKPRNILVEGGRICFVDLDGFGRPRKNNAMVKDLARLLVGLVEAGVGVQLAKRLIAVYCDAAEIERATLSRSLARAMRRIQERHARKYQRPAILIDMD